MKQQPSTGLSDAFSAFIKGGKRLALLYVDKVRLKTTEKLTILLSTVTFIAVIVALLLILMVFVSIGVGHLLATSIAPHMAYLIVAGFYLLLLIVMALLRRQLFINPISRFISRLLVEAPDNDQEVDEKDPAPVQPQPQPAQPEIDYDILADRILTMLNNKNSGESNDEADNNGESNDDAGEEEGGES